MKKIITIIATLVVLLVLVLVFHRGGEGASAYKDLIRVETPLPESEVSSPLVIRGEARGNWFFEATFPITLTNWDGLIIAEGYATAEGEWMTTEYVPFEATLTFTADTSVSDRGALILHKSNASGLPEHDDAFEYTVFFKESEGVFCTQEALLCPRGDYVGRTGPQCQFSPCAAEDSIVGILEQVNGDFRLLLESPSAEGEVSYVLPLEIRVSNPLQDFTNKRVRAYGFFTEGNIYRVETLEMLSGEAGDRTLGTLSVGETVFINGLKVTFNELVQEYRCPVDANCMEGGGAVANLTLQSDTDTITRNFPSDEAPAPFGSYRLSIIKIAPDLYSGKTINPRDYRLTLKIEK